jgi:ribonuclease PH
VDSNVVMTDSGHFVEVQGSGEESTFTPAELEAMLAAGKKGIEDLLARQEEVIRQAMKPADASGLKALAELFKK